MSHSTRSPVIAITLAVSLATAIGAAGTAAQSDSDWTLEYDKKANRFAASKTEGSICDRFGEGAVMTDRGRRLLVCAFLPGLPPRPRLRRRCHWLRRDRCQRRCPGIPGEPHARADALRCPGAPVGRDRCQRGVARRCREHPGRRGRGGLRHDRRAPRRILRAISTKRPSGTATRSRSTPTPTPTATSGTTWFVRWTRVSPTAAVTPTSQPAGRTSMGTSEPTPSRSGRRSSRPSCRGTSWRGQARTRPASGPSWVRSSWATGSTRWC